MGFRSSSYDMRYMYYMTYMYDMTYMYVPVPGVVFDDRISLTNNKSKIVKIRSN